MLRFFHSISICTSQTYTKLWLSRYNCNLKFYYVSHKGFWFPILRNNFRDNKVVRKRNLNVRRMIYKTDGLYKFVMFACCVIVNPSDTIAFAIPRLVTLTMHRFTRDTTWNDLFKPAGRKVACLRTITVISVPFRRYFITSNWYVSYSDKQFYVVL